MVEDLKWTGVCSLKYVEAKRFQKAEGFGESFFIFSNKFPLCLKYPGSEIKS